jgi:hypothetical protein
MEYLVRIVTESSFACEKTSIQKYKRQSLAFMIYDLVQTIHNYIYN